MSVSSAVVIRPLGEEDYQAWHRLWTEYLAFYETSVDEAVYQTTFARLLSDDPQEFSGLLAIDESGSAIGLVHYLFHRHAWKIENVCYLQDLYTMADQRGKGIGRALINAVYEAADKAGAPSVYWMTQDFNHQARSLYDKIGTVTPFIRYARG